MSAFPFAGAEWLPWLGELAARATLVLLLAGAAAALLWRASAAARHLVWCVGVLCVLALPLLSAVLPEWHVPVLPAPAAAAAAQPAGGVLTAAVAAALPSPAAGGAAWLPGLAAAVAAGGVLVGALWLAGGFWGVARLGRRAQVVGDPEWLRAAHDAAEGLGLRRPVLLLRSRAAHVPATWGLLWPSVVLPAAADGWTADRRRAVLAHELAHVKRFDCLTQALARAACVLLWWHPAVWYAARRLRVERERACDDLVLAAGARASDYATHLLEIAAAHRGMRLAAPALVSMAKPSQLESRLLRVLDGARARGVPSARATLLTALSGLLAAVPLAAVRPVGAAPAAPRAAAAGTAPAPDPLDELVALRRAGVGAAYVAEMRAAGYGGLAAGQLASLAAVGVSAAYVRELRGQGLADLPPEQLRRLKAVGVTGAYVAQMRAAGIAPLDAGTLADLHAVGITPAYARELAAAGFGPLTPERLARARRGAAAAASRKP